MKIFNIFNTFLRKVVGVFKEIFFFDLLGLLSKSYNMFFSKEPRDINDNNLKNIFNEIFPVKNIFNDLSINYVDHEISKPRNDYLYCIKNGLTFSSVLKAKFCISPLNKESSENFYNCEYVDIANIPLITENNSFVINGVEKVVISKFVRSPGIYFLTYIKNKKKIFTINIIPNKGLEFNFIITDNNILLLKILEHTLPIIYLLRYMGLSNKDIVNNFYNLQFIYVLNNILYLKFNYKYFLNIVIPYDIVDLDDNILVNKNTLITEDFLKKIKDSNIEYIKISKNYLLGRFLGSDIIINNLFLIIIGEKLDNLSLFKIKCFNIENIEIIYVSTHPHFSVILSIKECVNDIILIKSIVEDFFYKIGFIFIKNNFFNFNINFKKKILFNILGIRKKINSKLSKNGFSGPGYFIVDDFLRIIKKIILFKDGMFVPDDMQNLSSISLYLVGDMLYDIFHKTLLNLKKNTFERKIFKKKNNIFFPKDFLKFSALDIEIKKFFNSSRYSQFLDQTNFLSEISHKRRVSFLGMPGVSSQHSGFDVRDLNSSYYSKLCPVETPEGINIGLVGSLSLLTLINNDKELVSPYYKVVNEKVIYNNIHYLSTWQESDLIFSDSSINVFPNNFIKKSLINARCNDQLIITKSNLINYIDVLPFQILSVCASLIPFIEYNDSNRALMASNMLKQALPCLYPQRPIIGTGIEYLIGLNNNGILRAKNFGVIKYIDSLVLILEKKYKKDNVYFFDYDFYKLNSRRSSNQNTDISQRFIVNLNDNIVCDQILNDTNCTDKGELAIGQNMIVAFMSWGGYNFEDSIVVSEKVIADDRFTSLELFSLDISVYFDDDFYEILSNNIEISKYKLSKLDEYGIIKVGSLVSSGDLIVGKKTKFLKKKKKVISNEVNFLNSIFNKESDDFDLKNSSFYLPNNFNLAIVDKVEIFFSKDINLDENDSFIMNFQLKKILLNKKILFYSFLKKIKKNLKNFFLNKEVIDSFGRVFCVNKESFKDMKLNDLLKLSLKDKNLDIFFKKFSLKFKNYIIEYKNLYKVIYNKFVKVLPVNVSKIIKIHFIRKKKLQVGDKMSGRHGNKGVISKIVPVNEMPYMSDGTSIDVILNPLGVPSRMNIGQLLEVHLGLVSYLISLKIKSLLILKKKKNLKNFIMSIYSVLDDKIVLNIENFSSKELFDTAKLLSDGFFLGVPGFSNFKEEKINKLLDILFLNFKKMGFSKTKKQIYLRDGKTGKKYDNPVTVGIMYMLKLNHLSQDKIHSRSVGPYSLVTQQPLKGKANTGGQRLGEMEVWALEAYGASNTLREMLTIKSDDMQGRLDAYNNIVNGSLNFKYNRPESFDVMMSNINSMGIFARFME